MPGTGTGVVQRSFASVATNGYARPPERA